MKSQEKVLGRYHLIQKLGQGALGQVWEAKDEVLGRAVALKALRQDLKIDASEYRTIEARMDHEAKAAALLSHPGIIRLFDLGKDESYGLILVFELVEGPTLEEALRQGRLTIDGVARIADTIGDALGNAHEKGILHRDIKPANLMLTEELPKVADFGVAHLPESTLTRSGARVGTPAYSSPEVIVSGAHSPASDQFSLAATLYEALSGKRAFPGRDATEVAQAIQRLHYQPLAATLSLPSGVDTVLKRALSRNPEDRYPSARDFGGELHRELTGGREVMPSFTDVRSQPSLAYTQPPSWSQRSAALAIAFMLGAGVTLVLARWQSSKSSPPQEITPPSPSTLFLAAPPAAKMREE
ncbi:MAG: serine/threonine protein kinase [Polyangiaceae bacterium]|nr:serine/threonine protein kinase [Polyangiaceae bacterium]